MTLFGGIFMFRLVRRIRLLVILLIAALLLCLCQASKIYQKEESSEVPVYATSSSYEACHPTRMQAMWLSQFDLCPMLTENGQARQKEDFTARIHIALENVTQNGINTLFVQLRPNGDSLYPSELFPSSAYAVGKTGTAFGYDPFAILLELAHEKGLSVHGWINPLRLFSESQRKELTGEYRHLGWCEANDGRAVLVGGTWYLNPAYEEVRALVAQGVFEILSLYPVDGIHIDDYFYPTTDPSFDGDTYLRYTQSGGTLSLDAFRRDAVNQLIRRLYDTVHSFGGNRVFGVSPSGNNQRNYEELYADVAYWCSRKGYVDYLCPQIYFGMEHGSHDFVSVALQFDGMIQADGIQLYIGMTLEKAYKGFYGEEDPYAGSGKREWIARRDVLARCLEATDRLKHKNGVAFFSYQCLFSPYNGISAEATEEEWKNLLPLLLTREKK